MSGSTFQNFATKAFMNGFQKNLLSFTGRSTGLKTLDEACRQDTVPHFLDVPNPAKPKVLSSTQIPDATRPKKKDPHLASRSSASSLQA
jgi:hypothetical protein